MAKGKQQAARDRIEQVVSQWWNARVIGSPIGQSTEAYNHLLLVALPALKEDLVKLLPEDPGE